MTLAEKFDERRAMILVNKLYELAGLTVNQRQSLNDKADEITIEWLRTAEAEIRADQDRRTREKITDIIKIWKGLNIGDGITVGLSDMAVTNLLEAIRVSITPNPTKE